jgi:two-component system OmpR family sensor kinase
VRNTSIVARIVLVSAIVAAVAVVVAGLVALPLVRGSAESTARAELAGLSNLVAVAVINQGGQAIVPPGLYEQLQERSIDAYVVTGTTSVPPDGVTMSEVAEVTSGQSVSSVGQATSGNVYVEGRPIGVGRGVLLVQPASISGGPVAALLLRISLALLAGLVIAVVVGVVAARRITRPLRRVAEAAERLGAGDRDVSLPVDGPAEVVGIAEAINVLARELSASESRQRDFLLSVSHELRTPLTAIRGYAEALADGVVTDAARTGVVIGEESARLDRLVTDLLDLARLRADTFRVTNAPVDLVHLIQDAGHVWADRSARVGVVVHVEVGVRALSVVTDGVRIRQIVDNLAENSLRVTPAGKAIVLALRAEPGWVVVEVRDAGPGLTTQDCVEAFVPGVLHERYRGIRAGGSGLGLALVARLAELLGGEASAGIAPEGGARFTVRLPMRSSA